MDKDSADYRKAEFRSLSFFGDVYRIQIRDDIGNATKWLSLTWAEFESVRWILTEGNENA